MRIDKIRVFACLMSAAVAGTTVVPSMPNVAVFAQEKKEIGEWTFIGNGSTLDEQVQLNQSDGDVFGISKTNKKDNFSYHVTMKQRGDDGAVGVMMGIKDQNNPKIGSVVANITPGTGATRLFCFQGDRVGDLNKEKTYDELKNKETYEFDVTVEERQLVVKINGIKVYDMEISDTLFEGNLGLISFKKEMIASEIQMTDIEEKTVDAHLSNLVVEGGSLDKKFSQAHDSYSVVVENKVEKLSFTPSVSGTGTVTIGGKSAESNKASEVALKVGSQQIPIVVTSESGGKETTIINVLRNAPNSVYSVPTRPQYHFSPATAWCNDPNGMVYYNGEYHLFYQYYPDATVWGPMHWGHAVSKDLLHWEELPTALYYQEDNGAMFSGSCVVDDENKSGLFGSETGAGTGGLVAIYTQNNDGRGQDQCLAYSKDNGRTWTKYKGNPILKWNEDSLNNDAFRDPKVFYHEESGKYMMVLAGGLLRIYSSSNLIDWEEESTYSGNEGNVRIETECPDMYPLKADDGTTKWVVSEGGRFYRVGDFKEVNGKWTFVQDENSERYMMNFGPQSYAAQSYDNTPDGRRIMINWASTWQDGYCNNVSDITGKWGYNGFFNLQTELNLTKTENGYRLVQTPIKEYEDLRVEDAAVKVEKTIPKKTDQSENLLSGIQASQYEIVAEFTPKEGTKEVGFKVRTNEFGTKETIVKYNVDTKKVSINGDKSGTIPAGQSKGDITSNAVTVGQDGKVKLNIFVDESSVEVYAQDGQETGALAIFPAVTSTGMEVYSEGGETDANIAVYPMKSIWEDKIGSETTATDLFLSTDSGSSEYGVGDNIEVNAAISPIKATQEVTWSVSNNKGEKAEIIKTGKNTLRLKAKKKGIFTVTATTKNGLSRSLDIVISNGKLNSNIGDWNTIKGDWTIGDNGYTGDTLTSGDGFLMSGTKIESNDYDFETDAIYHSGSAFAILFRGQDATSTKAYAANIHDPEHKGDGNSRIFTFGGGTGDVATGANYTLQPGARYHLKVSVRGNQYKFYVNGSLIYDVRDAKVDRNYLTGQYVGLNTFDAKVTFQNIKVTPVNLKEPSGKASVDLFQNESQNMNLTMEEDDYNLVHYSTSNKDVAQVDDDGNITGKAVGTAIVTAKVTSFGREYEVKTNVTVKNPYVTVSGNTSVYVGKSINLTAKGNGISGNAQWKVNNDKIAKVSSSGVLKGVKAGTVYVTATIGSYSKQVKITVKKPYIKVTSYKKTVSKKKSYRFKAKAYGTDKKVVWSLSKKSKKYASMTKAGTLKTKKKKATITVYAKSGNVTKKLKVKIK